MVIVVVVVVLTVVVVMIVVVFVIVVLVVVMGSLCGCPGRGGSSRVAGGRGGFVSRDERPVVNCGITCNYAIIFNYRRFLCVTFR